MTEPPTRYRIAIPLAAICLLAILSSRFGGCLIGNERLGFRDVGFFFTPLYGYLAKRESDQALPLHNPLDELGVAIAGETTTALFYPPRRLIFGLIASPETAMGWYVVLHLVLAGVTAAYAARRAGGADWGSPPRVIIASVVPVISESRQEGRAANPKPPAIASGIQAAPTRKGGLQ